MRVLIEGIVGLMVVIGMYAISLAIPVVVVVLVLKLMGVLD